MSTINEPKVKLTYNEYVLFPSDGMRHEIINGLHFMNPAPSPRHQAISLKITVQLYQQIQAKGRGKVLTAPIDLQLSETDVVQPDILVVADGNDIVTDTRIQGVPDLIVEVLSPSNRKYDQELKKRLYEQHRVPEYWIVDPTAKSVEKNVLNVGVYVAENHDIRVRCSSITADVDLTAVWAH